MLVLSFVQAVPIAIQQRKTAADSKDKQAETVNDNHNTETMSALTKITEEVREASQSIGEHTASIAAAEEQSRDNLLKLRDERESLSRQGEGIERQLQADIKRESMI